MSKSQSFSNCDLRMKDPSLPAPADIFASCCSVYPGPLADAAPLDEAAPSDDENDAEDALEAVAESEPMEEEDEEYGGTMLWNVSPLTRSAERRSR